tara:strand:- start:286 stop:657 length:372 start_codon:yes stop_codon:yes gene_type:complete
LCADVYNHGDTIKRESIAERQEPMIVKDEASRSLCALHRTTDPETSRAAADAAPVLTMQKLALRYIAQFPFCTARELEKVAGVENGVIRKRLKALERTGRIRMPGTRRCSITGRIANVYAMNQ